MILSKFKIARWVLNCRETSLRLTMKQGGTEADASMTDLGEKFNKNIRPLLDAVDKLRSLKVTTEGIPLPSIVVVGDQSSGKSSVLESLATISLPRGQGIATRVPLILRLQSCRADDSSITISYRDMPPFVIYEDEIEDEVNKATTVLAGDGKGVTDTPISLHIRKPNAPDLTMIDLPGITRVPVHGQPDNIYEQIAAMIQQYITPKETVILNVLSATVDFSTYESIRMSQKEDKCGERTLAVVTKVDRAPEGAYEKVVADDVNIGLGYICVRNRTDDDKSHKEARKKERILFETHHSLSKLAKDSVGISSLAERLTQIQANIIRLSLPGIGKQIDQALTERRRELEVFTKSSLAGEDVLNAFLQIVEDNKTIMHEIVVNGNYDKYADENNMHYPARLDEMFRNFSNQLQAVLEDILLPIRTEEIMKCSEEMRGVCLPNFLSPVLMKSLVGQEIDNISDCCTNLVNETNDYALRFLKQILDKSTSAFPNLLAAYKQVSEDLIEACRESCMKFVNRALQKERSAVFTVNDYYMANVQKIQDRWNLLRSTNRADHANLVIDGSAINLMEAHNESNEYQSAFDMKVNLAAYWKVIHKRLADEISLEIRYSLEFAILNDLRNEILKAKMGKGAQDMEKLMAEHPANLRKRLALKKRVEVLMDCKSVVQKLF